MSPTGYGSRWRAEPIDVFPMLRPFCRRSVHHVLPYGGAWHDKQRPLARRAGHGETALETQTLDMNKYREQKDRLEYEAMVRNPETAYLVSNEEFDNNWRWAGRPPTW